MSFFLLLLCCVTNKRTRARTGTRPLPFRVLLPGKGGCVVAEDTHQCTKPHRRSDSHFPVPWCVAVSNILYPFPAARSSPASLLCSCTPRFPLSSGPLWPLPFPLTAKWWRPSPQTQILAASMERIQDKWLGAPQNATKRNVIERVNPSRCNTTVRAADRKDNGYVCVCAFDPMCTIGCSSRRDLIQSGFYYVARDTNSRIFRQTHTNTHTHIHVFFEIRSDWQAHDQRPWPTEDSITSCSAGRKRKGYPHFPSSAAAAAADSSSLSPSRPVPDPVVTLLLWLSPAFRLV